MRTGWVLLFCLSKILFSESHGAHLPTANCHVDQIAHYLQPTDAHKNNGGFGMVREDGRRFHGGIDIRPLHFSHDGEPEEAIFGVFPGKVVHINSQADRSSYGKYIVVEHRENELTFLTLYAHLSDIAKHLRKGQSIPAGTILGHMGRTSNGYKIPKRQSHLHFEMALQLGSEKTFGEWYDRQNFDSPNFHGVHNGMNMVSWDPLPLLQFHHHGEEIAIVDHLRNQPTAFITRVSATQFPEFLSCNAGLLKKSLPAGESLRSFEIHWTWYGLPKCWIASAQRAKKSVELLHCEPAFLELCKSRETLSTHGNHMAIGPRTRHTLEKIFGGEEFQKRDNGWS